MTYFNRSSFRKAFRKLSNAGSLPEMNPIGYLVPASTSPTGEAIINCSPLFFQSFQSVWLDEHGCPVGTALPQLSGLSLKPGDCEFGES